MSDYTVGEIRMFAGSYAPEDWALCDGQTLRINDYQLLYAVIGTTYGGDGVNDFKLPDMRGRVPIGMGTSTSGINYPIGQAGGTETVTLTGENLPAHTHAVNVQSAPGSVGVPTNAVWAAAPQAEFGTAGAMVSMSDKAISAEGGTVQGGVAPHDNMMPFKALSFIIALTGLYPDFD